MRKRIIDWIFTLQSQRGILGEKERRLYTYAYGLLLNKIAIYAIIAIVGTITGNWIGMFSFLLPFTILRQYAGGIHLEKPMNCIIFSGFLVFGCGQYLAVASDIGKILCALWVAAILLIFVLAPIDTKGKKLDKTAKKIYGRRARGVLVIEVMIAICFWVCGFIVVTKGIAIAHIILMVTVKPPYLPYGKKRKLSLSSFKNDLFILHLCRNCLFWRLPSQCFQLFQVCMDLPLCIKLIVVFCPKILIFHTVFQDMINRY